MAKRKRLTFDPVPAENGFEGAAPEVKAFLRPTGSFGSSPPIAQVAAEASAQAALAELSQAMSSARAEGRLVQRLALDQIAVDHLVRDRIGIDEDELSSLMASIREYGQRTPIEVAEVAPGRFGLISGWRRCQALTRLMAEDADRFGHVLALVRQPETAADAYVAMVEENEIRLGLSYYERARIAGRAVELGVFASEKQALQRLFSNASRARRSKIGSFLTIWRHLDGVLRFPAAITERLGLHLEKGLLAADAARVEALVADLRDDPAPDAAEEQARLTRFTTGKTKTPEPETILPVRHELRSGVFLEVSGGFLHPVLTLSGPGVGPDFREALEHWLAQGR